MRSDLVLALAGLGFGGVSVAAGQQTRPGNCAVTSAASDDWAPVALGTLKVAFRLPPDMKAQDFGSLKGIARRARDRSIPGASGGTIELVAAWQAPRGSSSIIRQVLLYSRSSDSIPPGRPCAMTIGLQAGLVFRSAFSGEGKAADEYWIEAYWPGFLLAGAGSTMDAYDELYRVLRSVVVP